MIYKNDIKNMLAEYQKLVSERKACRKCQCLGLTNPATIDGGCFDSDQIGPWSLWQGNLNAPLMVVGQDWDSKQNFIKYEGREPFRYRANLNLIKLLGIVGFSISNAYPEKGQGVVFFTNAILCLKDGNSQSEVDNKWFDECNSFLRRQIEIINPAVIVGLGEKAYRAIFKSFGMNVMKENDILRPEVERQTGRMLPNGSRVFAVYHCGAKGTNMNRPIEAQKKDWRRIRRFLEE